MDRSKEVAMLSQADRLIAEAERAIIDQIADFDKERVGDCRAHATRVYG
jgi:hypothetical protein